MRRQLGSGVDRGRHSGEAFVGRSTVLAGASPRLRGMMAELAGPIVVAEGEALFAQGDPGDALYVLDEGAVEIGVVSAEGRKLSLNVMGPGDVFGEIAFLDGSERTAGATALTPSRLRRVARRDFLEAMRVDPDLAREVIRLLCGRLRWVSGLLEDRAFLPLRARLARRLILLAGQIGDAEGAVRLSQAEIAEHMGATREGVAKILGEWRREGWVELSRGALRIADRAALEEVAEAGEA